MIYKLLRSAILKPFPVFSKYFLILIFTWGHLTSQNLEKWSPAVGYNKVVELAKNKHISTGKKLPLTIGIKAAKYEHLIFTDADCEPN